MLGDIKLSPDISYLYSQTSQHREVPTETYAISRALIAYQQGKKSSPLHIPCSREGESIL